MQIGIYGGSFDPPHVAHVLLATYALSVGGFDQVLVVPVFAHAFSKPLSSFEHRVNMCVLAFAPFARVAVSRIEAELPVPSRTLTTLERLLVDNAGAELRLIVGADVLADSSKWHAFDQIARMAPPFVVGRSGYRDLPGQRFALPEVSSTHIRELLARKRDAAAAEELAALLPAPVLEYIRDHELYESEDHHQRVEREAAKTGTRHD